MATLTRVLGADIGQRIAYGVALGVVVILLFPFAPVKFIVIPLAWYLVSGEIMAMWGIKPSWRAVLEWVVVSLGLLVALALLATAPKWAFVLVVGAAFTDISALFVGRVAKWGMWKYFRRHTHRLSEDSPKKTWEGVIGGIVGSVAFSMLAMFGLGLGLPIQAAIPVWIIPIVAVYGDLFESKLKREVGVKDASKLLGPHGGLLDRLDSVGPVFATSGLAIFVMLNISWLA